MSNNRGESFKTFGEMLRYLRVRERMTQRELALAVGYTDSQITRLEKGQRVPDLDVVIARFIEALHLSNQPEIAAQLIQLARQANHTGLSAMDEALPLNSEISRPTRRHNLPVALTPLIGREVDVAALHSLLLRDEVRLVTVIGPPGVGKTRLVLQAARDALEDFQDGVWFVPLASVSDPQFIPITIVQSFDLQIQEMQPSAALKRYFEDKQLLLVLDNIEQLLGKDDQSETATLVTNLLAHAPALKVILTSRATLRVQGEFLYPVPQLAASSAVELFIARAQAIKPSFTVISEDDSNIAEICKRLDYLPLAIELAAARVRMFDPAQLLTRLSTRLDVLTDGARDLPPRQRTLRNTIAWSYKLLSPDEQTLFRRLGIFAGGCTFEAVEQVASEGLEMLVLDLLQSLADKSLIRLELEAGETRVVLLEMLHEYALELLSAKDEMYALARRHAEYYVALSEHVDSFTGKVTPSAWMMMIKQLERESENHRLALAYARRTNDDDLLMRLLAAILTERLIRSPEAEDWTWVTPLLERLRVSTQPRLSYAKVLLNTAMIQNNQREVGSQTIRDLEEALDIFEAFNQKYYILLCLNQLGSLAWSRGEFTRGTDLAERIIQRFKPREYPVPQAFSLMLLATILRDQGEYDRSIELYEQSRQVFEDNKQWFLLGALLNGMGDLEFDRGNFDSASKYYVDAQAAFRQSSDLNVHLPMRGLGRMAYVKDELEDADVLLSQSVENAREWQSVENLPWILHHAGFVKHLLGDVTNARSLMREGILIQHRSRYRLCIAESFERFAWIATDNRQHRRAVTLLGASHALRKWMGAEFPLGDKPLYERYLAKTRIGLSDEEFNVTWAAGTQMSLDDAVDFALESLA